MAPAGRRDHTQHDPLLVAAYATGDLAGPEHTEARSSIEECADCVLLGAELRAISAATARLPEPVRTRDFGVSPAQAARLRSWPRRLLALLAGGRSPLVPRLAASLTSLGVAGLLLASAPGFLPAPAGPAYWDTRGSTDAMSGDQWGGTGQGAVREGEAPDDGAAPVVGPPRDMGGPASDKAGGDGPGPMDGGTSTLQTSTPSTLVVLSGSFLIVGLSLLAVRWSVGRFG
jgi:hypothetical protein